MKESHICPKCRIEKSITDYYRHKNRSTGFSVPCKECHKEIVNSNYDPVKQKNWNRNKNLSRYNLSINDYEEMLVKQNYCCAICETHISNLDYNLCVDHCHEKSSNRSLLCKECNLAIGLLKENIFIIEKAKEYLIKWAK